MTKGYVFTHCSPTPQDTNVGRKTFLVKTAFEIGNVTAFVVLLCSTLFSHVKEL